MALQSWKGCPFFLPLQNGENILFKIKNRHTLTEGLIFTPFGYVCFSSYCLDRLRPFKMLSQPLLLYLIVQLQHVVCEAQKHPFCCHICCAAHHESPE